jgi:hypothetical protein
MLRSTLRFTKVIPVLVVFCAGAVDGQNTVAARAPAKQTPAPLIGAWGGLGLSVVVTNAGAKLEFDCAHGTIGQPIWPNRLGRFTASGSYTAEKPGPVGPVPPPAQRAGYSGQIRGNQMTLTATLVKSRRKIGPYTVTRGQPPHLVKCL